MPVVTDHCKKVSHRPAYPQPSLASPTILVVGPMRKLPKKVGWGREGYLASGQKEQHGKRRKNSQGLLLLLLF